MSEAQVVESLHLVEPSHRDRRRQLITFAYWAIQDVLKEQHEAAFAELIQAQKTNESLTNVSARLAAIEDLRQIFKQHVVKENTPHAS